MVDKRIILGGDGIYMREDGEADVKVVDFGYDEVNNRITIALLDITGGTMLSLEEAATGTEMTGDMVDQITAQHNMLPMLTQIQNVSADPPATPTDGDICYVQALDASGVFIGNEGTLATWADDPGEWTYGDVLAIGTVVLVVPDAAYPELYVVLGAGNAVAYWQVGGMDFSSFDASEFYTMSDALRTRTMLNTGILAQQNTPPGAPADKDEYVVDTVPTDDWVGHELALAVWDKGEWVFRDILVGEILMWGKAGVDEVLTMRLYTAADSWSDYSMVLGETLAYFVLSGSYIIKTEIDSLANDPPGGPGDNDTCLVDSAPTGVFVGHEGEVATYKTATTEWVFFSPPGGAIAKISAGNLLIKDQTDELWVPLGTMLVAEDIPVADSEGVFAETDLEAVLLELKMADNLGHIGTAIWTPANDPTVDDEIVIGADTYIFKDTTTGILNDPPAAPTAADTSLIGFGSPTGDWVGHEGEIATCTAEATPGPVTWSYEAPGAGEVFAEIGGTVGDTLESLVIEVNARGVEEVLATEDGAAMTIITADDVGGAAAAAVLPAVSAIEGADPWVVYAPGAAKGGDYSAGQHAFNATTVAGTWDIALSFTPTGVRYSIYTAGGEAVLSDMTVVVGASKLTVAPAVGITPPAATNVLQWEAYR